MPPNPKADASPAGAPGFVPGVSYFQVLQPSPVLAPNGDRQYAMVGPFADLGRAWQYANTRPGALITVTLVLQQTPLAPAAPAAVAVAR